MNIRNLISTFLLISLLGLIQIFFLKNLALFGIAFAFLYVLGFLLLPVSIQTIPLMLIAFTSGLVIDIFYETLGMHAAAATLVAVVRPMWLKALSPTGGYDELDIPSLPQMGLGWFLSYSFPLFFLYSLAFFLVDQWGIGGIFQVVYKSFFSSILTAFLAILVQLLFFKRRRGI